MKILLFDMDGVLVAPEGYHRALAETVRLAGQALGYPEVSLTPEEIAAFEAAGVSSEWESSAICTALMLVQAWEAELPRSLPEELPGAAAEAHGLPVPDFVAFMQRLARDGQERWTSAPERAEAALLTHRRLEQEKRRVVGDLLRRARDFDGSVTHRVFQELALGSAEFERTYGRKPALGTASYLEQHDRPGLSPAGAARLRAWLGRPSQHGAVFTNRPCRGPGGARGTPEAEAGVRCVGVPELPILGLGGLSWLAERRGALTDELMKPSPVHALAALQLAAGRTAADALDLAAGLALDGLDGAAWRALDGARVWIFEDSAKGLHSAQAAGELLAAHGVTLELTFCGVTTDSLKAQALTAAGARVFSGLEQALAVVPAF
ncbi:MAG: hypothetical protein IT371_08970 [Deltaproteobacteria bacterium]|nr:hypothetical protein [Deltaproteobacteria bacterium]